jgi:hypothetical protein
MTTPDLWRIPGICPIASDAEVQEFLIKNDLHDKIRKPDPIKWGC